ncbi:nucleoside triphosphate hydrolase [Bacillus pseudomycoides]|uniref:nucleoside triphosphate hydrolase n=1 Tax=Bacillus pseudomycoides TaxID=64104 RepID=UPI000BED0DAB|nr:nucleoside triphosphate hydrolase [Bacillus pseudomycoides]PEE39511.1 nucleoside triphosphate hydrolase [Bacillus pseudomycoides]PGA92399.1 nucleoside triphosphate hydrolase [Bacillus pseudomycoides]PHF37548.1 nucleoside triphosphate hydrolase [Bacillus pseudomycoides]
MQNCYENNHWYYYDQNGVKKTGWLKDAGSWYLLPELLDGAMAAGMAFEYEGNVYYFHEDGKMATGWIINPDGGIWYYFDQNGVAKTGWLHENGKWYYLRYGALTVSTSSIATGWVKSEDTWYYFDQNGVAKTGWLQENGKWYYIAAGRMAVGLTYLDGNRYYFDNNGVMLANQWVQHVQMSKDWLYVNKDGVVQTGWLQWNGAWYYLANYGQMVTGKHLINGKWHSFQDNGVWIGEIN